MALPVVGLVRSVAKVVGVDVDILDSEARLKQSTYGALTLITTVFTVVLPSVLASILMLNVLSEIVGERWAAFYGVIAVWLGTTMWGWSACFFSHSTVGCFLVFGFVALYRMSQPNCSENQRAVWAAVGSFCLTWSISVEYTAPPAALLIFLWALWRSRHQSHLFRNLGIGVGAAALAFLPLLIYQKVCFGGWFDTSYANNPNFEGHEEGFLGVTYPKLDVLFDITVGLTPGLLVLAPILLFAPYGWSVMWKEHRPEAVLTMAVFVYFLLLNASFHYWGGAWVIGPRHLTGAIPFLAFPLAFAARDLGGAWRRIFFLLGGLSVLMALACACIGMTPPPVDSVPVYHMLLKPFLSGDFQTPLGVYLGLDGYSILGIYLVVAVPLSAAFAKTYR